MKLSSSNFVMTIVINSGLINSWISFSCKSFQTCKACRCQKSWYQTRNRKCAWYDFHFKTGSGVAGRSSSGFVRDSFLSTLTAVLIAKYVFYKAGLKNKFSAQVMEPKRLMNEFIKSKIETKPVPFEFDKTNKYRNGFFLLSHGNLQVNNGNLPSVILP